LSNSPQPSDGGRVEQERTFYYFSFLVSRDTTARALLTDLVNDGILTGARSCSQAFSNYHLQPPSLHPNPQGGKLIGQKWALRWSNSKATCNKADDDRSILTTLQPTSLPECGLIIVIL